MISNEVIIEMIDQEIEFYKSITPEDKKDPMYNKYDQGFIAGMIHIKGLFRKETNENGTKEEG